MTRTDLSSALSPAANGALLALDSVADYLDHDRVADAEAALDRARSQHRSMTRLAPDHAKRVRVVAQALARGESALRVWLRRVPADVEDENEIQEAEGELARQQVASLKALRRYVERAREVHPMEAPSPRHRAWTGRPDPKRAQ